MSKRIFVTMKKLDSKFQPILIDGEEVTQTFDPVHADTIMQQKYKYWEVVNDPRLEVVPPKESREESTEEKPKPKKRAKKKK